MKILLTVLVALVGFSLSARADLITGVNARASTEFGGRPAINAVNGSGLSGDVHSNDFNDMWLGANGDTTGTFEVDLGAIYNLDSIQVWNYNEAAGPPFTLRGVQDGTLEIATTFGDYADAGPVAFAQATGLAEDFSESFPFGGTAVRFLRLNIDSNYGDAGFTGLSELRFDGTIVEGQSLPIPIVNATATSNFGPRPAIAAANGSGLFGPTHTVVPDANMWLSDRVPDADITFDLGSVQALGSVVVWNYNETLPGREAELLGRGINEVDIQTSDDGVTFASVKSHNFTIAPGDPNIDFSETVDLGGAQAQFVKFDVISNHGNAEGWTGISEVQFRGLSADEDEDMLPDSWEMIFFPDDLTQLSGLDGADFDNDGLPDLGENQRGTDPTDDDSDDDMLTDGAEVDGAGARPATNPRSADTDGDTLSDLVETNTGVFLSAGDTGTDPTLVDSDGDNFSDDTELERETDPTDPDSFPLPGLVGYWPFDAEADPQPDLSGFFNDAAVGAGATWVMDVDRDSGVMDFDGNDSFLEAADSESLSLTGDFTIAAWINPTDYTTDGDGAPFRGIVGKTAGPNNNLPASYDLYLLANDGKARVLAGSPAAFGNADGLTIPAIGEWHHLAVSKIGSDVFFFYDGVADGQGTIAQELLDSDATLRIGNRTDLITDFLGRMDDVAIFDGGLAPGQITAIMDGDFSEFGIGSADFAISNVVYDQAAPSVTITFNSRPGQTYAVDFSTALTPQGEPGGWQELDDGVESQGAETTFVDEVAAGNTATLLYRVREL